MAAFSAQSWGSLDNTLYKTAFNSRISPTTTFDCGLLEDDVSSSYSDQLLENLEIIQMQDEKIQAQFDLLEIEKNERLENERNCNEDVFESMINFLDMSEKTEKVQLKQTTNKNRNTSKSFLYRNIQLAGSKMSKFNLTDEEKQQLDIILVNIDQTDESTDTNFEANAFSMSDTQKKRILDIDFKLETYFGKIEDLENSRICLQHTSTSCYEELLKEIDNKLNQLKETGRK